jgi:hypothetical protein
MAARKKKTAGRKPGKKKDAGGSASTDTIQGALFNLPESQRKALAKELEAEGFEPTASRVWKPTDPGEMVEGIMYMKREVASKFKPGETYFAYGFRTEDAKGSIVENVALSSAVLDRELQKIPVGTFVKIIFTGTAPSKVAGNNPTKLFTVFTSAKKTEEFKHLNYDETGFDYGANG